VTADAGAAAAAAVVTVMGIQCRGVEPEPGAPAAQHPAPSTQPTTGGAGRGGLAVAWRLLLLLPQQGLAVAVPGARDWCLDFYCVALLDIHENRQNWEV
jgi:hypothetical protein